jgi:tripartite-type tricarboxylate transporter receptor subunit TctC
VSYGTSGVGSPSHVSAVLLQNMTGTKFQLVSYRGAGQIMTDIISGHIDLSIAAPTVVLEQWRAGNARAFAVTAKDRISAAPDIPTVDEAGLPGFYTSLWWGLWVPRGAADYVIAKLNAAVVESLADPVVRARFAEQGLDMPARERQRPEALRAFQKAEIEKWWPIIKAASIKTQAPGESVQTQPTRASLKGLTGASAAPTISDAVAATAQPLPCLRNCGSAARLTRCVLKTFVS